MPPTIIGTYTTPAVSRGEVVTCLFRDCDCTVTSITSARIPWPRVQPRGQRGGSGLWVDAELRRAIRTESAAALMHWWCVTAGVVWRWRRAFGVGGHAGTRGTRVAQRGAAKAGAAAVKSKVWTKVERKTKSRTAKRIGLKPKPGARWGTRAWTVKQIALVGTDHDDVIARRIGRTVSAVRSKRQQLKLPTASGSAGGGAAWTAEELALLGTDTDAAVAKRIGRTRGAVSQKRLAARA